MKTVLDDVSVKKVSRSVNLSCGCICENPTVGVFSNAGWKVIACSRHSGDRKLIQALAESMFNRGEVVSV